MAGIDDTLTFHPLRLAILTVSDTRTLATDRSGAALATRVEAAGHRLARREIIPDDIRSIRKSIRAWSGDPGIDVILTTGGTGFSPRDVTPEAVRPLLRREMDGFAVVFHQVSLATVGASTLQSRALAGQIDDTFIFCLPGSTGGCCDAWDHVLRFELDSRHRPCSLASHVPRLWHLCA